MKKKKESEGEQVCSSGDCWRLRGRQRKRSTARGTEVQRIRSLNEVLEIDGKIISIAKKFAHWGFKTVP